VVGFSEIIDSSEDLMLVGHLPFMARLTSYLITVSIDRPVFKFQNGGILCLDKDSDTGSWVIKWALMPKIDLIDFSLNEKNLLKYSKTRNEILLGTGPARSVTGPFKPRSNNASYESTKMSFP